MHDSSGLRAPSGEILGADAEQEQWDSLHLCYKGAHSYLHADVGVHTAYCNTYSVSTRSTGAHAGTLGKDKDLQ